MGILRWWPPAVCLLALCGCAYTLDGLRPDALTAENAAGCPAIGGLFSPAGRVVYSSYGNDPQPRWPLGADLPDILSKLGFLDYYSSPDHDMSEPVRLSFYEDRVEVELKKVTGERPVSIFYYAEQDKFRVSRFYTRVSRFCSQDKLLARTHRDMSQYESLHAVYLDAAFRQGPDGLTVTVHNKTVIGGLFFMAIPWQTTRTGRAQFFFPATGQSAGGAAAP